MRQLQLQWQWQWQWQWQVRQSAKAPLMCGTTSSKIHREGGFWTMQSNHLGDGTQKSVRKGASGF
ncbi:hypothetical protein VK92_18300 [Burkholderia sp. LK4]|nr:hypothetical protein VL00_23340 [Burkholderia cepacia]KML45431.1 hypothetical protein VL13_01250 [Burkholderia lata]KMN59210.1 hypothetical protein VK92_18300 [Burkholderia sp. LK4]